MAREANAREAYPPVIGRRARFSESGRTLSANRTRARATSRAARLVSKALCEMMVRLTSRPLP
jgi:hypothetical protein